MKTRKQGGESTHKHKTNSDLGVDSYGRPPCEVGRKHFSTESMGGSLEIHFFSKQAVVVTLLKWLN